MPALISQLFGRTPQPWLIALSTVVVVAPVPNSGFDRGPSSLSCGTKSPLPSFHVRVAVALNSSGLFAAANAGPFSDDVAARGGLERGLAVTEQVVGDSQSRGEILPADDVFDRRPRLETGRTAPARSPAPAPTRTGSRTAIRR